jgi:hypothetical protein
VGGAPPTQIGIADGGKRYRSTIFLVRSPRVRNVKADDTVTSTTSAELSSQLRRCPDCGGKRLLYGKLELSGRKGRYRLVCSRCKNQASQAAVSMLLAAEGLDRATSFCSVGRSDYRKVGVEASPRVISPLPSRLLQTTQPPLTTKGGNDFVRGPATAECHKRDSSWVLSHKTSGRRRLGDKDAVQIAPGYD